jgi:secreted trypsin-like serine protease
VARRCALVSLLWLASLAACAPPEGAPAHVTRAIIGGTSDSGDPAVVLLISYPPDESTFYTCTASFISPSLLVTAAHCVDATNHPSYVFGVFLGSDALAYPTAASLAPVLVPVKEVHANPAYNPQSPFTADIGVVVLSAPQSIAPLPFQQTPLASGIVGQAARLVGYGQTVYGQFNDAKYSAATTVASLGGDDTVSVGDASHHSCVGDSGGPALVMMGGVETIIGVDSYTDVAGCTEPSHYRRVDEYVSFLQLYLPPPPANDLGAGAIDQGAADAGAVDSSTEDQAESGKMPQAQAGGCSAAGGRSPREPASALAALALALALAALARLALRRRAGARRDPSND